MSKRNLKREMKRMKKSVEVMTFNGNTLKKNSLENQILTNDEMSILKDKGYEVHDFNGCIDQILERHRDSVYNFLDISTQKLCNEKIPFSEKNLQKMQDLFSKVIPTSDDIYKSYMFFVWKRVLSFFNIQQVYFTYHNDTSVIVFKYKGQMVMFNSQPELFDESGNRVFPEPFNWNERLKQFYGNLMYYVEFADQRSLTNPIFYLTITGCGVFSDEGSDFRPLGISITKKEYENLIA